MPDIRDDNTSPVVQFSGVSFDWMRRRTRIPVARDVNFSVAPGESVALTGASGTGKSTILQLASGILVPSTGTVELLGTPMSTLSERDRASRRLDSISQVFQDFRLLPKFTAQANVELTLRLRGVSGPSAHVKSLEALDRVGMSHRASHRPSELSGGEKQRVAIARAIVTEPRLLLADEPTGSLDTALRDEILDLLLQIAAGAAVLIVTHDAAVAAAADRTIVLDKATVTETV